MNPVEQSTTIFVQSWSEVMFRICWQGGLAIMIALPICYLLRTVPAWTKSWLWRGVHLKFLVGLILIQPIAIPILKPTSTVQGTLRGSALAVSESDLILNSQPSGMHETHSVMVAPFTPEPAAVPPEPTQPQPATQPVEAVTGSSWTWAQLQKILFSAWVCGVIFCTLQLLKHWRDLTGVQRSQLDDAATTERYAQIASELGVTRVPTLVQSKQVPAPMLVGVFRPAIILPTRVLQSCSSDQIDMILRHELAHVSRRDLFWGWLATIVEILFFFHPLIWWASRRSRLVREMACDRMAIDGSAGAADYAGALVRVAELSSEHRYCCRAVGAACVFESSRSLSRRLIAMKSMKKDSLSLGMCYGFLLGIGGAIGILPWQAVSRADDSPKPVAFGQNLSFEEAGPKDLPMNWYGGGKDVARRIDTEVAKDGKASARMDGSQQKSSAAFTQCQTADALRGKRVLYTGYLKTKGLTGLAGLWMRVDKGREVQAFDNMSRRPVRGDTDWKQYEVVLDVPEDATKICFGFIMHGTGTAWCDQLAVSILGPAGEGRKTTDMGLQLAGGGGRPVEPRNLGFEEVAAGHPVGWGGGGVKYELTADSDNARTGSYAGRIESNGGTTFGTFTQMIDSKNYRGKRVKYSGFLKTKEAQSAALWMRVDGSDKPLAFDNMHNRRVKGTTEWTAYHVTLDVAENSNAIAIGFLNTGTGTVWADDLKVEVVDPEQPGNESTAITSGLPGLGSQPSNLGFEETVAGMAKYWGGGGKGAVLSADRETKRSGNAAAKISRVDNQKGVGVMTQMCKPGEYAGKRVTLSGHLKTDDVDWAGLWFRVDGPNGRPLAFDNMARVRGSSDWKEYSITLDVPDQAVALAYGFLMNGTGSAWCDDLKLEIQP